MKTIGFISEWDVNNPTQRSGVPHHIYKALVQNGYEVKVCFVSKKKRSLFSKLISKTKNILYNQWFNQVLGHYYFEYSASYFKLLYQTISSFIKTEKIDVLLAINSFSFTYSPNFKPTIVWIDNSFFTFFEHNPMPRVNANNFKRICKNEKQALHHTSTIICASNWLKSQLIARYNIPEHKIAVVPRGANLTANFSALDMNKVLTNRLANKIKLVFIGRKWDLKGGDIAFAVCEQLREKGYDIELVVFGKATGCPINLNDVAWVTFREKFDLSNEVDLKVVKEELSLARFLVVPSRADGFGIVFAEAATFGLPSVALDIMGVENAVINDVTGKRFEEKDTIDKMTHYLVKYFDNEELYRHLCLQCYEYAIANFDWKKNVKKIIDLCQD
ncbi:MAG: glycosyltransferase family 4 protein [Vicingaceae bacterium]|nr:glycosyltransferase family 4 protein [Vicingaceae bacterium]